MQKTGGTNHTAFQFGHFSSLVWSRLVWYLWSDLKWKKSFTYGFDHLDAVNNHFLLYKAIWAWWQPNERTNNRVILEQACSCPVRRQSLQKVDFSTPHALLFVSESVYDSSAVLWRHWYQNLAHWLIDNVSYWAALEFGQLKLISITFARKNWSNSTFLMISSSGESFKKERVIPCSQIPVYNFETF